MRSENPIILKRLFAGCFLLGLAIGAVISAKNFSYVAMFFLAASPGIYLYFKGVKRWGWTWILRK